MEGTTVDPIDRDLPPAFPPWMRRLDPLLAAEDTNPIFEAFRRRRLVHSEGRRRTSQAAVVVALTIGAAVGLIALSRNGAGGLALGLLVGAIGGAAIAQGRLGHRSRQSVDARLPVRLRDVLGRSNSHRAIAIDIWATGCGSTAIVEALYLEYCANHFVAMRLGSLLAPIGAAAYFLFMIGMLLSPAAMAVVAIPALWVMAAALKSTFGASSQEMLERATRPINWFHPPAKNEAPPAPLMTRARGALGWGIYSSPVIAILLLFIGGIVYSFHRWWVVGRGVADSWPEVIVDVMVLSASIRVTWRLWKNRSTPSDDTFSQAVVASARQLENYMRVFVLEDWDSIPDENDPESGDAGDEYPADV